MFSQKYLPYIKAASALELGSEARNFTIAAGVAAAVSRKLTLPSAPVLSAEAYYNQTHGLTVNGLISQFNEVSVLGVKHAIDLTRRFWLLRYELVHGDDIPSSQGDCFAEKFSKIYRHLAADDVCCLNKHTSEIGLVQYAVAEVLNFKD